MGQRDTRRRGFDAGVDRRSRYRAIRRKLVLLAMLLAFVEFVGTPHLRVSYAQPGRRGVISIAEYWGVTGARTLRAGGVASTCPLIVLLPLDRSLVSYAGDGIDSLLANWN